MINRDLAREVKSLMPSRERDTDRNSPVSMWNEMDRLRGKPEETTVVIFRTRGCSWYDFSSCSMCGYFNDVNTNINVDNLKVQIDRAYDFMERTRILKIFTSGSFLDQREVPEEAFNYFMKKMSDKVEKLLVESRTEYVTDKIMKKVKSYGVDTRIAIGVESSNDYVIKNMVNKGTTFSKFINAAKILKNNKMELRSYLLLKPPYMSEEGGVQDAIQSVKDCAPYSDDISVNPMNIQKNTLVEKLWKKGEYRPPWLWSVVRVLLETQNVKSDVISYPTGGDRERGAHNDDRNQEVVKLIFNASLNQDFRDLEDYYNRADKRKYMAHLRNEECLPIQYDLDSFIRKISAGSVKI
ncbi:MAG: archaeosine biosynthesis radical SAM protein RaSEA [Cuniculiplasma sp.]